MTKSIIMSVMLLTLLVGLSVFAGTPQDWGKWKEGELLLENHSFEEDLAAWGLEDGHAAAEADCTRWKSTRKTRNMGNSRSKLSGIKQQGPHGMRRLDKRMLQ